MKTELHDASGYYRARHLARTGLFRFHRKVLQLPPPRTLQSPPSCQCKRNSWQSAATHVTELGKVNFAPPIFLPAAVTVRHYSRVRRIAVRTGLLLLFGPGVLILLFRFVPVPLTPLMVIRLVQGYELHHDWIAYDDIAPALAHAVVASEDNLFCRERFGFDGNALAEQVDAWWQGERPRGASTITMQTARNLLLWPGRDIVRKALELWLTVQIALLWPKERVLEVYLNSVEFGPGIYGAQAAAMHYFGRNAAQLTDEEAARLAVVLPDPLEWSAAHPGPYVRERAVVIRHRIAQIAPLLDCTK